MPPAKRPTIETRYDQMFPVLQAAEIERLRRFGTARSYAAGEQVVTAGEPSPGMIVVLKGELAVTQHNVLGHDQLIVKCDSLRRLWAHEHAHVVNRAGNYTRYQQSPGLEERRGEWAKH